MSQDNTILLVALGAGLFLYTQSKRTYPPAGYSTVNPASMPGSAGNGWQQVGMGAVQGFLRAVSGGIGQGAQSYVPSLANGSQFTTDYLQSGTVQDDAGALTPYDIFSAF